MRASRRSVAPGIAGPSTVRDHDARRTQIAEAACRVFLRLGLERTSLADIAREIGNTTGVLRHYFADKDAMLLYAKNLVFDRSFERAGRAAARRTGLDKLRAIATELLPVTEEAIDAYRLLAMFNGSAIGDAHLMKLQHKRNRTHAVLITELITHLQSSGDLPGSLDARREAAGILALLDGLAGQVIVRSDSVSRDDQRALMNRYIDNLRRSPN